MNEKIKFNPVPETTAVEKPAKVDKGTVICDRLNVRQEANISSEIIKTIAKNTTVEIIGESNDFYKVKVYGIIGYCMKEFITKM